MAERPESSPLQFDRADYASETPAPTSCGTCSKPIDRAYYEVNGDVVCAQCVGAMQTDLARGTAMGRFARAATAGAAAAALGSGLYFAVAAVTGYEFGLIAIVVGFAVGAAVRWGSRGRGGWVYQTLAVMLTYLAIVATYIPPVIAAIREQGPPTQSAAAQSGAPADGAAENSPAGGAGRTPTVAQFVFAIAILIAIVCAAPFLAGFQNIIGLLIISFGLYEAWKLNRRRPLAITGPHAIGRSPQVAVAGA